MDPIRAVLVFCATLFFVLSPALTGGFSGYDPALFPVPQINAPAQPAGYAFAIWGLIYVWLLISAGAGLFTRSRDTDWEPSRLPLILSLGPGTAWIGVAGFTPIWATVLIFWMLGTAIWALALTPRKDRWLLQAPVALYTGWLTGAAWVSLALIGAGWDIGPGPAGWAVIALLGALATGALVLLRLRRAPEYAAALIWALVGIVVANAGTATGLALLAALGAAAIGALALRLR
ncbi:hypothetical protein [Actibacterium sp. D379-3]